MLARSLGFALLALAFAAPAAGASLGDAYVPDSETLPGVKLVTGKGGERSVRFGPEAAKLYRGTLAGRRATVACAGLEPDDGWFRVGGSTSSRETLPRRRGAVHLPGRRAGAELCAISTKRNDRTDGSCVPTAVSENGCIRVIVPLTDDARAYLDAKKRAIELSVVPPSLAALAEQGEPALADVQRYLGPDVVELPSADASPPAGKVGYFKQGEDVVSVALLADGRRVFLGFQAGVFSTNVPDLMGPDDHALDLM